MTCRSCGADIADNAIVCYKCGTATADPVPQRTPARRVPASWMRIIIALWLIPVVAWFVLPSERAFWGVTAVTGVVTLVMALWMGRRR